ncbi:MAG: UDP-N-acetylmuramate--L-alanine ligase, partial [Bacteroidetes bacterium]|nr:UDP-N-acetylmuramate--L-alanine ligase [Bacteroidota bacterium]
MKYGSGHQIFFLGIGGIGMSALARYFMSLGSAVSGYDLTQTPLTLQLEQEGVSVFYKDDPVQLPSAIDLAVITPAIPVESKLLAALQSRNVRSLKRSQVLGKLSEEYFTVAIAGTHGKTTITALTAQIFQAAGLPFMAFIGGIANNFNSNLVLKPDAHILLVEADEFDRSFLTLSPDIALISSVEADHLDIYGSHEQLIAGFVAFANCLPSAGKLVLQQDQQLNVAQGKLKYGTAAQADVFASGMDIKDGKQYFKLHWPDNQTADIVFPMPGIHNLNNA